MKDFIIGVSCLGGICSLVAVAVMSFLRAFPDQGVPDVGYWAQLADLFLVAMIVCFIVAAIAYVWTGHHRRYRHLRR